MGTWSGPFGSVDDAEELIELLKHPIPAHLAGKVLYSLMGDDSLFDEFDSTKYKYPMEDVRPNVISKLEEWLENGKGTWRVKINNDAWNLLKTYVERYRRKQR